MRFLYFGSIYALFFSSGAAALMYEVVWVRSLSLVFGGTHLAVTAVLTVFMGGLALGSYVIGRRVDRVTAPLKLYGYLEIGIAVSAAVFIAAMQIYPSLYSALAEGKDGSRLYLSLLRILFTCGVLIVPTTLMGGTLPLLTRLVTGNRSPLGTHLSFLYGLNTLGAVAGAALAGFVLLRYYSVSTTLHTAMTINCAIGVISMLLRDRAPAAPVRDAGDAASAHLPRARAPRTTVSETNDAGGLSPFSLVLLGIGVSGFCAMGYEVLWTRILTLTIGTSVYGFTITLIAFLAGIALGSEAFGLFRKWSAPDEGAQGRHLFWFGVVQLVIGITALIVTANIRDLPANAEVLRELFLNRGLDAFNARQWGNMTLAISYMIVPSFFMGLAFPLAGSVNSAHRKKVGRNVGDVLTYNTVGAIGGSAVSGFVMIYLFGLERSLQLLTVVNIGLGLFVMSIAKKRRTLGWAVGGLVLAATLFLALDQQAFRMWDSKYFAIFRNNQPEAFNSPEKKRDAMENTDVLFYYEGIDSTISAIRPKGGQQAVLVNGKVVASSALKDQQCQQTLGHLPMLLHKDPKKVLVIGLGTGMTLGAVSVHPSVEELTLAEIEPRVAGAARTFAPYNHEVLDDPRLHLISNDGRNFLMTTKNRYDVITADPIHPWTQGSGYLYTTEYFAIASEHLRPGGIMCQWLPIYELSTEDLRSVARTFSLHFNYTMLWLTQYDAEIIGSNAPLIIDETALAERIAFPAIARDLKLVMMGSAEEFLSYFVMGTDALKAFGRNGVVNTDDNLYLEFSAPLSVGINVMRKNVDALARHRESILPYLVPARTREQRQEQVKKWEVNGRAAVLEDRAHALFLGGQALHPEFQLLSSELEKKYPSFAPGMFLRSEFREAEFTMPVLVQSASFAVLTATGEQVKKEISAVLARVSGERAALLFVDNEAKIIYGQRYFSGPDPERAIRAFAAAVMTELLATYRADAARAAAQGNRFPPAGPTLQRLQDFITLKLAAYQGS